MLSTFLTVAHSSNMSHDKPVPKVQMQDCHSDMKMKSVKSPVKDCCSDDDCAMNHCMQQSVFPLFIKENKWSFSSVDKPHQEDLLIAFKLSYSIEYPPQS